MKISIHQTKHRTKKTRYFLTRKKHRVKQTLLFTYKNSKV